MVEIWVPILIGIALPVGIMGGVLLVDRLEQRVPERVRSWPARGSTARLGLPRRR